MRVRRFGKSYAHPLLVLVAQPSELNQSRLGVSASRSLGNAVKRNRAKRRLRAALQPHLPGILPGWDAILIARQPILDAEFSILNKAVASLLLKAGMTRGVNDAGERRPPTLT